MFKPLHKIMNMFGDLFSGYTILLFFLKISPINFTSGFFRLQLLLWSSNGDVLVFSLLQGVLQKWFVHSMPYMPTSYYVCLCVTISFTLQIIYNATVIVSQMISAVAFGSSFGLAPVSFSYASLLPLLFYFQALQDSSGNL